MEQYSKEYGIESEYLMKFPDCGGDNGIKMVRTHFMISDFFLHSKLFRILATSNLKLLHYRKTYKIVLGAQFISKISWWSKISNKKIFLTVLLG